MMKRVLSIFLTILFVFSVAACGKQAPQPLPVAPETNTEPVQSESETVSSQTPETNTEGENGNVSSPVKETIPSPIPLQIMNSVDSQSEWDTQSRLLCSAQWEELALGDDYPQLMSALENLNIEQAVGAYSFLHEWIPYAEETIAQTPEDFYGFTFQSEYTVQRADSIILSVREDYSSYTGGIHGDYGAWGHNFDTITGKQVYLTDVLTDTSNLVEILAGKIREKYTFEPFESLELILSDYQIQDYSWTMNYQGITFYFSPYAIASYVAGLLTVTIWFDEMPQLFVEQYTIAPESGYAMALPDWHEIEFDLNPDDGVRDRLSIWETANEYGEKHITLSLNDRNHTEEDWSGFRITPYLVYSGKSDDFKTYLYVESQGYSDFSILYVYDLSDGTFEPITSYEGTWFECRWMPEPNDEEGYYHLIFNNPFQFTLMSRCDLLGTNTIWRDYTIGSDGFLCPLNEVYQMNADCEPIVSSRPLKVRLLPQMIEETVPKGTAFTFLRTDNSTYVDLAMSDGRECRISLETTAWPPTINGIPEWEYFENLLYAG